MAKRIDHKRIMKDGGKLFLPSLSIDCAIFGFHSGQLKVLLLKMKHVKKWSLPGGFVFREEDTDDAAARVLQERTGIDKLFLQQFRVFGNPGRSDASVHRQSMKKDGFPANDKHWILQRFVTIGYYALVEFSHVNPLPDDLSEACQWWGLAEMPDLMMDHRHILDAALDALRLHLNYHPVGYNLLPDIFTMPQLQKLYETILGKKLDRRNFQRKMLGYQILKRLKEPKPGVAHKSPYQYSFDLQKYHKALKEGLKGGW
ncbi:MAG: NUDIX domain-containing protein [Chitinophagaceae bacterium]